MSRGGDIDEVVVALRLTAGGRESRDVSAIAENHGTQADFGQCLLLADTVAKVDAHPPDRRKWAIIESERLVS
jgi:hypothetical protein